MVILQQNDSKFTGVLLSATLLSTITKLLLFSMPLQLTSSRLEDLMNFYSRVFNFKHSIVNEILYSMQLQNLHLGLLLFIFSARSFLLHICYRSFFKLFVCHQFFPRHINIYMYIYLAIVDFMLLSKCLIQKKTCNFRFK